MASVLLTVSCLSFLLYARPFGDIWCTIFPPQSQTVSTGSGSENEPPFACNLAALNNEDRIRKQALGIQLWAEEEEIKELSDGYAIRLPSDESTVQSATEWIVLERKCCPFFDFELLVERNNGSMWLKLKGREGVKDFIKSEFNI